mgnify:CR=1 FL=1
MWTKISEPNLNVMLAELLSESGIKALGEVTVKRFRKRYQPDVILEINGIRIIIEGKYPGQREKLIEDAEKRIENGLCDIVAMVEYVDIPVQGIDVDQKEIREALRKGKFNVAFMTPRDYIGLNKWIRELRSVKFHENIDFQDLVALLMDAYDLLISESFIDKVVEGLENKITDFSEKVKTNVSLGWLKAVLEIYEKEKEREGVE